MRMMELSKGAEHRQSAQIELSMSQCRRQAKDTANLKESFLSQTDTVNFVD